VHVHLRRRYPTVSWITSLDISSLEINNLHYITRAARECHRMSINVEIATKEFVLWFIERIHNAEPLDVYAKRSQRAKNDQIHKVNKRNVSCV